MVIRGVSCMIDGVVYKLPRPYRHYHLTRLLISKFIDPITMWPSTQGFWILDGIHIDRVTAANIVRVTGQCKVNYPPYLYSEDLW